MLPDTRDARFFSRDYWLGDVDARPLALLRIGLAATVLYDAIDRLSDLRVFETDDGILPRSEMIARAGRWSLFDLTGSALGVGAIYAVGVAGVLALLVGWRTRVASVVTLLFVHSLLERNVAVCDSGDNVLRVMCFWLAFADSGACFSLDARRTGSRARVAAFPVRLLQLQVAVIYLFGAASKTGPDWRHGTAVERALLGADFARPSSELVLAHPVLGALLSRATLVVEWLFPFAVFTRVTWARRAALLAGVALHAGIFLTMRVGIFSIAMPVTYLVLLHSEDLGAFVPRVDRALPARPFPRVLAILLAMQMALVLAQQIARVAARPSRRLSAALEATCVWQNWSLFAPEPPQWKLRWEARSAIGDVLPDELRPDTRFAYRRWLAYRFKLDGPDGRRFLTPLGHRICRAKPEARSIAFVVHATPIRVSGEAREGDREEVATMATVECGGGP